MWIEDMSVRNKRHLSKDVWVSKIFMTTFSQEGFTRWEVITLNEIVRYIVVFFLLQNTSQRLVIKAHDMCRWWQSDNLRDSRILNYTILYLFQQCNNLKSVVVINNQQFKVFSGLFCDLFFLFMRKTCHFSSFHPLMLLSIISLGIRLMRN